MFEIEDPDDPRIFAYQDVRERDLVGRENLFIAEGEMVLRHLIGSSRFAAQSVLLARKRAETLGAWIELERPDVPVFLANQEVMDRIVGFPLHRGVLAVGRRQDNPNWEQLLGRLEGPGIVLVLMGVGNHDNMGGLFRNAAAFGCRAVLLDSTCCDPLYRKAIRVSVGAALTVPFARVGREDDVLEGLGRYGFGAIALSPNGAERLSDFEPSARTSVLFGAEGPGLPNSILKRCRTIRIPMAAGFDSLNVGTSAGIVLHHLANTHSA